MIETDEYAKAYQRMYCCDVMHAVILGKKERLFTNKNKDKENENAHETKIQNFHEAIIDTDGLGKETRLTREEWRTLYTRKFNTEGQEPSGVNAKAKYFRSPMLYGGKRESSFFTAQDRLTGLLNNPALFKLRQVKAIPFGLQCLYEFRFTIPFQMTLFNDADRFAWAIPAVFRRERRNRWTCLSNGANRLAWSVPNSVYNQLKWIVDVAIATSHIRFVKKVFNDPSFKRRSPDNDVVVYKSIRQSYRKRTEKYGYGDETFNLRAGKKKGRRSWYETFSGGSGKHNTVLNATGVMGRQAKDDRAQNFGKTAIMGRDHSSKRGGGRKVWKTSNIQNRMIPADRARRWAQTYIQRLIKNRTVRKYKLLVARQVIQNANADKDLVSRIATWGKSLMRFRLDVDLIGACREMDDCNTAITNVQKQYNDLGEVLGFWLTETIDQLLIASRLNMGWLQGYADSRGVAGILTYKLYLMVTTQMPLKGKHGYPKKCQKMIDERKASVLKYSAGKDGPFFKKQAGKDLLRKNLRFVKDLFIFHWGCLIGEPSTLSWGGTDLNDTGKGEELQQEPEDEECEANLNVLEYEYYIIKSGDKNDPQNLSASKKARRGSLSGTKFPVGTVIKAHYVNTSWVKTAEGHNFPITHLDRVTIAEGTKIVLNNDQAGTISHSQSSSKGEVFVITMDDGSTMNVYYKDIKAKLGPGHWIEVIDQASPFAGKVGLVTTSSKSDPTYVGVKFGNGESTTEQKVPVNALKILPNGADDKKIQNNMTTSAGNPQATPEQLAAMDDGGMSTGMMVATGFFIIILLCAILGGLYLLLGEDEGEIQERRMRRDSCDSFVDLEAGHGRRRPQKSELEFAKRVRRKKSRDQKEYLSGKELKRAASRRHRHHHRHRLKIAAPRAERPERRSRRRRRHRSRVPEVVIQP